MNINQIVINQPPFPDGDEADAIIAIGVMFGIILMILIFMLLAIYYHNKADKDNFSIQLIIWLFSIFISFGSMSTDYFPHGVNAGIFLLIFHTLLFFLSSLKYYTQNQIKKKKKRGY